MRRYSVSSRTGLKMGAWTPEEDQLLTNYITRYGHWNWHLLPKYAGLSRCGKSCRLRWLNYLRPNIKRGNFTKEEEDLIISLHEKLGNRWSAIVTSLPGRTDNDIKNYWYTHLKKRYKESKTLEDVNGRDKLMEHEISTIRNPKAPFCEPHTLTPIVLESSSLFGTSPQSSNDFSHSIINSEDEGSVSPVPVGSPKSSQEIFDMYTNFWEHLYLPEFAPFLHFPYEESSYLNNMDFSAKLWMN